MPRKPVLTPLFLELDTLNFLHAIKNNLSRQRNAEQSVSDAVEFIIGMYYKKTIKRLVDQKHADKVGDRLKGSRLIKATH